MSTVTIRLNQEEETFFKSYASLQGASLSTLFKQSLAQQIEDAHDLNIYKQAKAQYLEDMETVSHADFKKSLGF
ncbi:type II toxin-antitoxin system RelB family antitoxin [Streptococcus pluranimalium]|uniref:type II toxin-antitoxin system RelB family antitoxin n=1 Tax=Streptococcus pluranimalium TaxID=82348 RepID=UPI0039FDA716